MKRWDVLSLQFIMYLLLAAASDVAEWPQWTTWVCVVMAGINFVLGWVALGLSEVTKGQ